MNMSYDWKAESKKAGIQAAYRTAQDGKKPWEWVAHMLENQTGDGHREKYDTFAEYFGAVRDSAAYWFVCWEDELEGRDRIGLVDFFKDAILSVSPRRFSVERKDFNASKALSPAVQELLDTGTCPALMAKLGIRSAR